MNKIVIVIGSILGIFALILAILYFARPYVEPSLQVVTIAKTTEASEFAFGLGVSDTYTESGPAVFVVGRAEEVDTLTPTVFDDHPALTAQLRQVDYDRHFVLLALQGVRSPGHDITIRKITRREDRVSMWAEFVEIPPHEPQLGLNTYPFHLVAVAKNGSWGEQIHFDLMKGYKRVADTSQFIPS